MTQGSSTKKNLFRENALKNINSLDEIHGSLKINNVSAWLWLVVSLLFLMSIAIWGLFGQVAMDVTASGIIIAAEQFSAAENFVNENWIERQRRVNSLKTLLEKKEKLYHKHYLTITELEQAKEDYIAAKQALTTRPTVSYINATAPLLSAHGNHTNQLLYALVFVNHHQGKKVSAGMDAYVLPSTMSLYEYGYIRATVVSVSDYPASKEAVYSYLGNMSLVDEFFNNGAPFMVKIKLKNDYKMQSQLSWTSKLGPQYKIAPGTMVDVKIINKVCPPIELLTQYGRCR